MKFFAAATAFLACTVSLASAETPSPTTSPTYTDPSTVFNLGTTVESDYSETPNRFTLRFDTGTTFKNGGQHFTSEFYDFATCQDTVFGESEVVKQNRWGFPSGDYLVAFAADSVDVTPSEDTPVHQFDLDMSAIKGRGAPLWNDSGDSGLITFCVRSIIGTTEIPVNFFETQITVEIDLLADVITDVKVEKREVTSLDKVSEDYTVRCYICDGSGNDGGKGTSTDLARQGDMVNVCMQPNEADIAIVSLKEFNWTYSDQVQHVVRKGFPDKADNPLSTEPNCDRASPAVDSSSYCGFSSMMRASFYDGAIYDGGPNTVEGEGQVLLALNRRNRRLNEIDVNDARTQRLLQGVGGDVSVSVPISNEDTGPGSLKTAGGASFGTAFASGIALLGAVLFA